MLTVAVLALRVVVLVVVVMMVIVVVMVVVVVMMVVVMVVVLQAVAVVVLLLQAEGHSGLVAGGHMQPVLLLQLPPGLVPLCLQLSQSSSDKLLLWVESRNVVNLCLIWTLTQYFSAE